MLRRVSGGTSGLLCLAMARTAAPSDLRLGCDVRAVVEARRLYATPPPNPVVGKADPPTAAEAPPSGGAAGGHRRPPTATAGAAAATKEQLMKGLNVVAVAVKDSAAGIKEEHYLPIGCVAAAIILWYWTTSNSRRTKRLCEASEAQVREKLKLLEEQLADLKRKWETDMKTREEQVRTIQRQNSELTKHIDSMSSELKRCQVALSN